MTSVSSSKADLGEKQRGTEHQYFFECKYIGRLLPEICGPFDSVTTVAPGLTALSHFIEAQGEVVFLIVRESFSQAFTQITT